MKGTHLIVCKSQQALQSLKDEYGLLGTAAEKGKLVSQGDALAARDALQEQGYRWGEDFYIKKFRSKANEGNGHN